MSYIGSNGNGSMLRTRQGFSDSTICRGKGNCCCSEITAFVRPQALVVWHKASQTYDKTQQDEWKTSRTKEG